MIEGLLSIAGLSVRDLELTTFTLPWGFGVDGVAAGVVGLVAAPDPTAPWQLLAVRVDAGPASGLAVGVELGTDDGLADLWSGSLPLGVWSPNLRECGWQWNGGLWGSMTSAEVSGLVEVEEGAVLGGTLDAVVVGDVFKDYLFGFDFTVDDYLVPEIYPTGDSDIRTIAILTTAAHGDAASAISEWLLGRSASTTAGLGVSVRPNTGQTQVTHYGAGGAFLASKILGVSWVDGIRRWMFISYSQTAAADMRISMYPAGDPAAVYDDTDDYSGPDTSTERGQRAGNNYTGPPWSGLVEQIALFDGELTSTQRSAIAQGNAATLSDGVLLGFSAGKKAGRATGGSVSLLMARARG